MLTEFTQLALALMQALLPWGVIVLVSKHFLQSGRMQSELIRDLTQKVMALKNPWAEQQYLKQVPLPEGPRRDTELRDSMDHAYTPDDEEDTDLPL